jgi:diguanylate cyclase (GGDEF)-like protein/PAS domain S-box-containing protein
MAETKILVVEDSSIVAIDIKRSLQKLGYNVVATAASAEEAIAKVVENEPELILMDIRLKGDTDGVDTARIIKDKYDIPIIYLTAYSDEETLERAKLTEPFGYIIKPFEERELQTAIEMALYKHQMDLKIKESQKWLSITLQSIGDAVIATDERSRVKFLNPIAERLTGWSQSEAFNRPLAEIFKIVSETSGQTEQNPVDKVFETGTIIGLANHTILINKNGQRIPIDDNAAPIRDENGRIIGVVLVFRDITERREIQRQIEQSEERYRAVVEQASEGIYLVDVITKRVVEANKTFQELLGYSNEEVKNLTLYDLLDYSRERIDDNIRRICEIKQPLIDECKFRCKNNSLLEMRMSATLITYGGREVICGVAHDISERKRAEEALRKSEAKFRMLVQSIPDLMLRVNKDGVIKDFKPAKDFDSPVLANDIVGKAFIEILPEPIADLYNLNIEIAIKTGDVQVFEYSFPVKQGTRYREARIVPVTNDEVLILIRDITERKEMEEQLKYLSLHDPLTGIYNRTYFEEELYRLGEARQLKLGIIICDLDGLKLVNDTLGHERGDVLLKATAEVIKRSIRQGDLIARIGGDEFAILLADNDVKIVEAVCQRIKEQVEQYNKLNPELLLNISFGFAVSTDNTTNVSSIFKEADDNMYREKLYRSQSTRSTIVQAMMKVLEVKDFITEGHANRLQELIVDLATSIGLPEPSVTNLRLLAQFHDIGKVGTPDRVLFKEGVLNGEEKLEIQRHAEIGNRIAKSIPDLVPIADWILKHHEWWNGEGYPLGLKGEEIPLESRILAIADAYDAMTSDRPYRKALSHEAAVAEIKKCAGSQFDPMLVERFIEVLAKKHRK